MREGQPRQPQQPRENRDSLLNRMGRIAGKAALGVTLALGGAEVGYQAGKAEMVQPEQEHTEQDAKELAGKLEEMIDLVDEHAVHMRNRNDMLDGVPREHELEEEREIADYAVTFAQALGMTPDFQIDPSVHPTWPESEKSDEIYELINQVLSRSGWNDRLDGTNGEKMVEVLRQQAMNLRGVESK